MTKLLSPSHAQHSVSLYNDNKSWMANNGQAYEGFRGFLANRFGRIAELVQEYLDHRESIQAFFDAVVDVNSNKLVLAVSTFIQNSKDHGGPVTLNTLDTLSNLNEKQLLQEISYLRQTIAPNIRQMRCVKADGK